MHDLYTSEIGITAEIGYRRRHLTTLRKSVPHDSPARKNIRAILAEALAHLALHLDGGAIGSVADRHHASHGHGRAA